jgi:hypothetical protein
MRNKKINHNEYRANRIKKGDICGKTLIEVGKRIHV